MDIHKTDYHSEYHLYYAKTALCCSVLKLFELVDFYPLTSYIVNGHQMIPLKHGIFST